VKVEGRRQKEIKEEGINKDNHVNKDKGGSNPLPICPLPSALTQ
jgi:hypothetical protein